MGSFDTAIEQEPERFIGYALNKNKNIKDFSEFKEAFLEGLEHNHGEIAEQTYITLFEHQKVKDTIKENVDSDEYDKLYGDGNIVKREVVGKQVITITEKKHHTKEYYKNNKPVASYDKSYRKWNGKENDFIQDRVAKKKSPTQIAREFNINFKKSPRTMSSITSKASKSGKTFRSV